MNNYDPTYQPEVYRKEHSAPVLSRIGTIVDSIHTLDAVVSTWEMSENQGLPGYTRVDVAGVFLSKVGVGPVASKEAGVSMIPAVALTDSEKQHFLSVGGHYTIAEMEARLAARQVSVAAYGVTEQQIANDADHGMKDIYAELDSMDKPQAVKRAAREQIQSIGTEETLEDYFDKLDKQPAAITSQELSHTLSDRAIQAGAADIASGLEDMLEQNSMEKL
ncbi:MAG: hypothetical protein M3Q36_02540 [bacterium]|nr:hypothetical protein [bacterium]